MKIRNLHSWKLSYGEAVRLQSELSRKVRFSSIEKPLRFAAGLDCSFSKDGQKIIAVVVVLRLPGFEVAEIQNAICPLTFPYIPGLLSFREAPACIKAVEKLKIVPDIFIVDGQGVAHPRRFGIASHLGLFFDKPTVGCAKSRLIGIYEEPPLQKGSFVLLEKAAGSLMPPSAHTVREHCSLTGFAFLKDKIAASDESPETSNEVIGAVVRTRTNVKPVFVSVGHKCTLEDAVETVLACTSRYRLPEPTRLAHKIVSRLKLGI